MGVEHDGKAKRGWCRRRERYTGALESWREPWLGNKLELSRSATARVVIWKQNAKRVRIWNTDIKMGGGGGGLHDQQLSIDQRLKNCTLKSLLTSKSGGPTRAVMHDK